MRTKHLFYTAAVAALFAACVNDDFETISKQQNAANDGRPVVGNVNLNFTQAGVDTRLAFGAQGYAWETNDTIGALLMDNVSSMDENKSWLERYKLVNNIHTSYPFTYSTTDQTWGCNTKMLEGNYFFAYPWESYEGKREVRHSLLKQSQNGIGSNVVAESYADNQFFIGYSQIMAGTEAKDALTDVEMVPLLGAIQLRIVNTGTQSYHLNKIVLSGNKGIASVMTFDPTTAEYGTETEKDKWNLQGNGYTKWFNYANYTDNEADVYTAGGTDAVYNIEAGDKYDRVEALRAVAKNVTGVEKSAQLTILGTAEERELLPAQGNTAYVLIMCNPIEVKEVANAAANTNEEGLFLSIYADEGFVQNINLSRVNGESTTNTVVTEAAVKKVGPSVANTIRIQLEDNSFITPEEMTVYNSTDLLQFIKWNAAITGNRDAVAKLAQDVTFTKEMLDVLKANKSTNLTIEKSSNATDVELTLAEDVPANVLDEEQLTIKTAIVVEGALELTEDSEKGVTLGNITVEKGATLTINDEKANVPSEIENNGTLDIGANAALKSSLTIENYGTMEVTKGGDSKANVTNYADAVINNNGYMQNVTNKEDAIINLGENSTLSLANNEGKVVTAKGATVNGTNNAEGEIQYVEGAVINATGGIISTEFTGATLTDETFEDTKVNKVILTKSTTVTTDVTLANVEIAEGGELIVNEGKTLTVTDMLISGSASISGKGKVSAENMEIEEEADVTVANTTTINVSAYFNNEGMVYNNGTFNIPGGSSAQGNGWKYNDAGDSSEAATLTTMKTAVTYWVENATAGGQYYQYNPTDVEKFVSAMEVLKSSETIVKNLATAWGLTSFTGQDKNPNFVSTFNSAVNSEILNQTNVAAATKLVIKDGKFISTVVPAQDVTLHENETKANEALKADVVEKLYNSNDKLISAAAYGISGLETYLAATTEPTTAPYTYIWKGCKLYKVMEVYAYKEIDDWNTAFRLTGGSELSEITNQKTLTAWMTAILSTEDGDSFVQNARKVVEEYINEYKNWKYSKGQISACK